MKQTKVAFVGQPKFNLPLEKNDLDDMYATQNFSTVFDLELFPPEAALWAKE